MMGCCWYGFSLLFVAVFYCWFLLFFSFFLFSICQWCCDSCVGVFAYPFVCRSVSESQHCRILFRRYCTHEICLFVMLILFVKD